LRAQGPAAEQDKRGTYQTAAYNCAFHHEFPLL
jgi:hypothetical protein